MTVKRSLNELENAGLIMRVRQGVGEPNQLKQLTRKERTYRLCTRGDMLESFLQEPERLTDDDVMLLLKLIFYRQDTQELLKKLLEREKPEILSLLRAQLYITQRLVP